MRTYKVNKIEHTIFDSIDEVPSSLTYKNNWKKGSIGDWVLADDGAIIQILREGTMLKSKGSNREQRYIGTCVGTFLVSNKQKWTPLKELIFIV